MIAGIGTWDQSAAMGVASFAIFQLFTTYKGAAPSLADLRKASTADYEPRQLLLDADVMVGALAIGTGAMVSLMSGTWSPVVLMVSGFVLLCGYYHSVLSSASPAEVLDSIGGQ